MNDTLESIYEVISAIPGKMRVKIGDPGDL